MNILKFDDLDLCSIGTIEFPENDPWTEKGTWELPDEQGGEPSKS